MAKNFPIGVGGLELTASDKNMVNKVLDSNRLSYGPYTRAFESTFAKLHQSKFAVFTNSGTSSLHIALAALKEKYGWSDDDEVIVPAVTFVATSNIVLHNGMKPVFVDVDKRTFNIDPNLIEQKISARTKAIIPVHLLGLPADMDPIMKLAKKHNLRIIEDSAETMFAKYKNKTVGSFGDIGCFSTYIAHYIVTGVGGLNTTSKPDIAVMLRSLMNHGRDSIYLNIDDDNKKSKKELRQIIPRRFKFVRFGHSFRATEMEAALGLSQLHRKDKIIHRRKTIAKMYTSGLKNLSEYLDFQEIPKDREHVYMMFGLIDKSGNKRDLVNFLEDNLIETRDILPLINQPVYKKRFGELKKKYPVADYINKAGFYIGCHQYISNKQVNYVIEKFNKYFKQ